MRLQAPIVRIGTRGSRLALAQAQEVWDRLRHVHHLEDAACDIRIIKTSGDRIQDRPLSEAGGKGLFTKEIEDALIAGDIDLAVHSMKDMPTVLPRGLTVPCLLPRGDVRDAFISFKAKSLAELPAGARVGTSSLRRAAQVRRLRPDLQVVAFRGNVDTRLKKLADGIVDATLLACAGLNRLGLQSQITAPMSLEDLLPAVAQAAIGIEIRADDEAIAKLIAPLNHEPTALCVTAERAFLEHLEGSCRTPIAGLAELADGRLVFRGEILLPDGRIAYTIHQEGLPEEAIRLGHDAAAKLLAKAGPNFIQIVN
jgi:hydroxymethylbilane synthase